MKSRIKEKIGFRVSFLLVIAALLLTNTIPLMAEGNIISDPEKFGDWEVVGPSGGDVRVITIDPKDKNRLYISTLDGQIHTSPDGGKTWRLLVNLNRPQLILDQLMVDSQNSQIIYTSGHRHKSPGGFFKSSDGGATWKESKALKNESIHSMTQAESDPETLLVGTTEGVWISKDSGDDWEKIASETMPVNVGSLAVDPRNTSTMFAGTWWRAYKSTDSGKNWRLIKNGMIDDSDVFAMTINSRNPNHIVASACSGIYESFNAGEKWAKIQGIPAQSRRTRDILQHPSVPGTIYAATTEGFWMTTNGGKAWALTTRRDLEINSIAVHPDEPNRVYIGTNNYGVMVSNDGGKNFTTTNDNFSSRFTYSVTPDRESPNRLYATTHNTATGGGFVFSSDDAGKTWQQAKNLDVNRVAPYAILQDRINPVNLYLGTNLGLFQSVDRGASWTQITPPKPKPVKKPVVKGKPVKGKTAAKAAPSVKIVPPVEIISSEPKPVVAFTDKVKVLTYTEDGKNGIFAGTDNGLYRTYDMKKGWEKISLGEGINENIFVVYSTPLQPETIWVGTATSGVLVSRDNGSTWQKTNGIKGIPENVPVSSIMVDAKRPNYVYVGTSQTFYLSRDAGKTWTRRGGNLPLGNYTSILINPANSDEIFISSALESDGGVFFSDNGGMNWKRVDNKNMKVPSRRVWTMVFDPNDSNRIYAGSHSSGVYVIERKAVSAAAKPEIKPETKIEAKSDSISRPRIATGN